jgi:hypothetical protein
VDGNGRHAVIGMTQSVMTPVRADDFEAAFIQCARINSLPVMRLRCGIGPPAPVARRQTCDVAGAARRPGTAQSFPALVS